MQKQREAAAKIQTDAKINVQAPLREPQLRQPIAAQSDITTPAFYGKDDKVAGRTISDYAGDFLHFTFSRSFDPKFADFEAMSKGIEFQHGPVWFLALGIGDSAEREIVVPKNTPMFFSLGWGWYWLEDSDPDELFQVYHDQADIDIPTIFKDFEVSLDYQPLPREAIIFTQSPRTY